MVKTKEVIHMTKKKSLNFYEFEQMILKAALADNDHNRTMTIAAHSFATSLSPTQIVELILFASDRGIDLHFVSESTRYDEHLDNPYQEIVRENINALFAPNF
jgi:hypothetical protein